MCTQNNYITFVSIEQNSDTVMRRNTNGILVLRVVFTVTIDLIPSYDWISRFNQYRVLSGNTDNYISSIETEFETNHILVFAYKEKSRIENISTTIQNMIKWTNEYFQN